jgi:hypothetical protein
MSIISAPEFKKRFDAQLLEWARKRFDEEIRSDFARIRAFDSPMTKDHLSVLLQQTPEHLCILARVLPLGVSWETPDAIERRNRLSNDEKEAVEKLRLDYNMIIT